MTDRACVICGKSFKPKNSTQQCCCTVCANIKTHETLKKYNHCVVCGKPFWKPNAHRFKYCSAECRQLDFQRQHPKKEKPEPTIFTRECGWCGQFFTTTNQNKKYCCKECSHAGYLKLKRDQWAEEYVPRTIICKECGSEFTTECGDKHSVFCCQSCADKYERNLEHQTERHKAYMREAKKKREQQLIKQFVSPVSYDALFERDQGICQICGMRVHPDKHCDSNWSGTIDHIIPLSIGGEHSMSNCQLAHRICNSLKGRTDETFSINWERKATENNYWRNKYSGYLELMS